MKDVVPLGLEAATKHVVFNPRVVHAVQVKHDHVISRFPGTFIRREADVVENPLRELCPVSVRLLCKLQPLACNVLARCKRPENPALTKIKSVKFKFM